MSHKHSIQWLTGTRPGLPSLRGNLLLAPVLVLTLLLLSGPAMSQASVRNAGMGAAASDTSALDGHGIKVRNARKNVLFGNCKRSKTPSIVDYKKALAATPEARKCREDGIDKNSAEYAILKQKAVKRLKKVLRSIAVEEGRDCVVKKGAIRSKGGADVVDLTDKIVSALESADLD